MMINGSYSQLIILSLLIISSTIEAHVNRHRRQVNNPGVLPQKSNGPIPFNNVPMQPSSNPPVILPNRPNNNNNNNHLLAASQSQVAPIVRSNGFYNNPSFQPPPFTGEKPQGWFGTNHINWVSNQYSEIDKNKLAADKFPVSNSPPKLYNPRREDGGPQFLRKVARQYATKGLNSFDFDPTASRQGQGSVCTNYENFDGYTFGSFACPLPASTGMNQLDQFCCGSAHYQYCCNAQEFSYTQRGGLVDTSYIGADQRFPKHGTYLPSTKRILAIIGPIFGFIILAGSVAVVVLFYKRLRNDQNRARKPAGAVRLDDNYSIVPQDLSADRSNSPIDDL